jgi:hypothetical protein
MFKTHDSEEKSLVMNPYDTLVERNSSHVLLILFQDEERHGQVGVNYSSLLVNENGLRQKTRGS